MNFLRRRPSLPSALKPALVPDERVVAWSRVADDQAVVATNYGLWLPGAAGRLGWHEIHKAAWSGRELRVIPGEVAEERDGYVVTADAPAQAFLLLEPGDLPDQVRTRVTRSVAYTTHHPMPAGAGGVRVVGRRVAGQNGLSWAVRYDAGTPAGLPAVVELTDELVATARATMSAPD